MLIDKGEGYPIVFLHGYLSNKESFNYQIEYFSRFFRVISIDITGFGSSKPLPYAYSLDDYVFDVLSVIKSLNLTDYYLVAHSFGGRIAIKIASNCNGVKKLVLTGSAGLKPKRSLKYYLKVYLYKLLKNFLTSNQRNKFGSSEYKSLSGYDKESYYKIVNEYLDDKLNKIKCKTLIVFGENDFETPSYMAKRLNRGIKGSFLYFIKNAGHFCFLEKPNEFNVIVNEFLRG